MTNTANKQKGGWWALSPLAVFLCLYLVTSLIVNDFYKVPITVAFLLSSCYAIALTHGLSLEKRVYQFSVGASNKNIILMIWIFILAGAFAQSAKQMGAIPVLLGDNIGTCITAIMAAWRANVTAKRVALAHVLFNLIGSILFVTFMGLFIKLVLAVSPAHDIARQIANAHTAFNIINTLIFLPFAAPFIKLVERLLPGSDGVISRKPIYLDVNMLKTPSIAMTLAGKEVVRMGTMARHNVELSIAAMEDMDSRKIAYVLEHEPVIDALEEEVTKYLTQMSETQMSRELSARHTGLLHACNDIERIGDHGETLAKKVRMIYEDNVKFSDEAKAELHTLGQMVLEASGKALEALEKDDKKLAEEAWALCRQVKQYQKEIRKNHIVRLNEKRCDPVAGFVMLELLINMKRVSDHSKNISQLVLGIF